MSGNVVSVMSQVSGRVEKVLVRDHQYVKAGERLIIIDPTDVKLALDAALSSLGITVRETAQLTHRLAEVRARIRSERLNLTQKKDDYERRRALFANRAVSREEYLHAKDAYGVAQHDLEALRAQESELIIAVGTTPIENGTRMCLPPQNVCVKRRWSFHAPRFGPPYRDESQSVTYRPVRWFRSPAHSLELPLWMSCGWTPTSKSCSLSEFAWGSRLK